MSSEKVRVILVIVIRGKWLEQKSRETTIWFLSLVMEWQMDIVFYLICIFTLISCQFMFYTFNIDDKRFIEKIVFYGLFCGVGHTFRNIEPGEIFLFEVEFDLRILNWLGTSVNLFVNFFVYQNRHSLWFSS